MNSAPFRFDADTHTYHGLGGTIYPHITGMLVNAGLVDDRWFTEESCDRGREVHRLCMHYDLDALQLPVKHRYVSYLMAYAKVVSILRPEYTLIEVPCVHPVYGFGGRPDRVGHVHGALSVIELKTGGESSAHQVQTALQAILVAPTYALPPQSIQRYVIYLGADRKYKVDRHRDPRDFTQADDLIRRATS